MKFGPDVTEEMLEAAIEGRMFIREADGIVSVVHADDPGQPPIDYSVPQGQMGQHLIDRRRGYAELEGDHRELTDALWLLSVYYGHPLIMVDHIDIGQGPGGPFDNIIADFEPTSWSLNPPVIDGIMEAMKRVWPEVSPKVAPRVYVLTLVPRKIAGHLADILAQWVMPVHYMREHLAGVPDPQRCWKVTDDEVSGPFLALHIPGVSDHIKAEGGQASGPFWWVFSEGRGGGLGYLEENKDIFWTEEEAHAQVVGRAMQQMGQKA